MNRANRIKSKLYGGKPISAATLSDNGYFGQSQTCLRALPIPITPIVMSSRQGQRGAIPRRQLLANACPAQPRASARTLVRGRAGTVYLASLRSGLWDLLANDYAATYLDASFVAAISARR